jgi:hypothetical protein
MIALGIIGLIIVLGIIGIIIGRKKYNDDLEIIGWLFSVLSAVILIIVLVGAYPSKARIEYDIAVYDELKTEVQQLSTLGGDNCELNLLAKGELFNKVREMNNYIDKNRIKSKSPWVSIFYSEEIGNLEKIELK